MKWLRMILEFAPEVVALGKDVRSLVEGQGYNKQVLRYVVEKLGGEISARAAADAKLRMRITDLEERLEALEVHA